MLGWSWRQCESGVLMRCKQETQTIVPYFPDFHMLYCFSLQWVPLQVLCCANCFVLRIPALSGYRIQRSQTWKFAHRPTGLRQSKLRHFQLDAAWFFILLWRHGAEEEMKGFSNGIDYFYWNLILESLEAI